MRNPWADEFEREFARSPRSPACLRGAHRDCPHQFGLGGGFNPRRLRPEFGAGLCKCSCHASCPIMVTNGRLTVSMKSWHISCTCPGAERYRQRLHEAGIEIRDFGEMLEEARRRAGARKEAFTATRARAEGRSKAKIREIYVSELQARGLKMPTEAVLDAVVDRICGNPFPAVRILGEGIAQMSKGLYELSRIFRQRP